MGFATHSNSSALSAQVNARGRLGERLRIAREQAGVSIDAISQETKISRQFILYLESGQLESLPGQVFGRGFVKNISRFLRADAGEVLRLYDACWNDGSQQTSAATLSTDTSESQAVVDTSAVSSAVLAETPAVTKVNSDDALGDAVAQRQRVPDVKHLPSVPPPRFAFKIPSWLLRAVVSPHVRLSVLTTIAFLLVAGVFGRWVVSRWQQHRRELALSAAQSSIIQAPKTPMTFNSLPDKTNDPLLQEPALASGAISDAKIKLESEKALNSTTMAASTESDEAPVAVSSTRAVFEQMMEVHALAPVELKMTLDGKRVERVQYTADSYKFTFQEKAELTINDASLVDVIYNGRSLGVLGGKGRKRRILFQAKSSDQDFK